MSNLADKRWCADDITIKIAESYQHAVNSKSNTAPTQHLIVNTVNKVGADQDQDITGTLVLLMTHHMLQLLFPVSYTPLHYIWHIYDT